MYGDIEDDTRAQFVYFVQNIASSGSIAVDTEFAIFATALATATLHEGAIIAIRDTNGSLAPP